MKPKRKIREKCDRIMSTILAIIMLMSQIAVPQYSVYAVDEGAELVEEVMEQSSDYGMRDEVLIDEGDGDVQPPSGDDSVEPDTGGGV